LEKDSLGYFDFEKGLNDTDEMILTNSEERTAYEKLERKNSSLLNIQTQYYNYSVNHSNTILLANKGVN
jgi:hypothetical protein